MTEQGSGPRRILVVAHRGFQRTDLPELVRDQFTLRLINRTEDLEEALESYGPDGILIETSFPDGDSYTAIERTRVFAPSIGILAVTPSPPPPDQVALASRAGADGFIADEAPPETLADAIESVSSGASWYPPGETRRVLGSAADELDTTSAERRSRLSGLILAMVPVLSLIAAIQTGFWRQYMGQIGVRPVDLAVDPSSRVIDVVAALLLALGVFGPLLMVGNWLDMLTESRVDARLSAFVERHRVIVHLVISLAWLVLAALAAVGPHLILVAVIGPLVAISIMAKAVGASDEIPRAIRIEGISIPVAVLASLLFSLLFIGVLSYEVFFVGPDLRTDGEHGYIAPKVLGVNAVPVEAHNIDTGEVSEVLYLGGNADLYVLVDVCDGDRVDYVSVGTRKLVVIDEVTCPDAAADG